MGNNTAGESHGVRPVDDYEHVSADFTRRIDELALKQSAESRSIRRWRCRAVRCELDGNGFVPSGFIA